MKKLELLMVEENLHIANNRFARKALEEDIRFWLEEIRKRDVPSWAIGAGRD